MINCGMCQLGVAMPFEKKAIVYRSQKWYGLAIWHLKFSLILKWYTRLFGSHKSFDGQWLYQWISTHSAYITHTHTHENGFSYKTELRWSLWTVSHSFDFNSVFLDNLFCCFGFIFDLVLTSSDVMTLVIIVGATTTACCLLLLIFFFSILLFLRHNLVFKFYFCAIHSDS